MARITTDQISELLAQDKAGTTTRENLQAYLRNPKACLPKGDAPLPAPNLDGFFEVFEVKVGGHTIKCTWIPANYFASDPTNQEVMDETARRHFRCSSQEVASAVFDLKREEMTANPSVAIDGQVQTGAGGGQVVGCVCEGAGGRGLSLSDLQAYWSRRCRFLVVVSK